MPVSQCFGWCLKASFHTQTKSKCLSEGVRIQRRAIFQDWLIKISFGEVAVRLIDGNFRERPITVFLARRFRENSEFSKFQYLALTQKLSRRGTGLWWKFIGETLPKSDHKALFHIFNLGNKNIQYSHGSAYLLRRHSRLLFLFQLSGVAWYGLSLQPPTSRQSGTLRS